MGHRFNQSSIGGQELLAGVIEQAVHDYMCLIDQGFIRNHHYSGRKIGRSKLLLNDYRGPAQIDELCDFFWDEYLEILLDAAHLDLLPEAIRRDLDEYEHKKG